MMVILVTANNFLLMFVGWEGVGVCSYLLVCFWYGRIPANQSALSAFLTNRVGDCFLTVGMFAILLAFGNLDYETVFSLAAYMNENVVTIVGICLLIGAMAKSSQLGQWRPLKNEVYTCFFRFFIYAGKFSNTLESVGPVFATVNHIAISPPPLSLFPLEEKREGGGLILIIGLNALAVKILQQICKFFFLMCYGMSCITDPEKFQRQGNNQQVIDEIIKKRNIDKDFIKWFIGFTEGDGSFVVTSKGSCIFSIHLHSADTHVLYLIQNQLNMGNILLKPKTNSVQFYIKTKKDILDLIQIFNGNLFLYKKQKQFINFVNAFNITIAKDKNLLSKSSFYNTEKITLNVFNFKPTLSDSWLAGFIDAEGCFTASVRNDRPRITQKFNLVQKNADKEMTYISSLLKGNFYKEKNDMSRVHLSYTNAALLIVYLYKHELYTIKKISYSKWKELYDYRTNKDKLTKHDYPALKKKVSLINATRKITDTPSY
jgi:hypothetical protein